MGLNSGGFSPWKASMGRGSAKRGGGCEQLQTRSPGPGARTRERGPVREDARGPDPAKYASSFTWKCSAARCGSTAPESLPALNPLAKPSLGSYGCCWILVSRRASGGKQKGPHCGEVGVSIREKTGR